MAGDIWADNTGPQADNQANTNIIDKIYIPDMRIGIASFRIREDASHPVKIDVSNV